MKKETIKFIKKAAMIGAVISAAAFAVKFKKDSDTLKKFEEDDDDFDFGDITDFDAINPDTSTREYVSINITADKDEQQ